MDPSAPEVLERRVLVLAPLGKDAQLISRELLRFGYESTVCAGLMQLLQELERGFGAVLLVEEALQEGFDPLARWLAAQPAWSDPPLLLLTRAGPGSPVAADALLRLGNVALIERPVRIAALLSAVRSAARARMRQYQTRGHLEEREAAHLRKDQFLATLAHELRNPLAPISSCVTLLRHARGPADVAPLCDMLERQARQLIRLVDDLMDVSRITRGKIALRTDAVDMLEVLVTAVETVRPQIEAARHRLELDLPTTALTVHGDPVRLCQVFCNLLSNAAKYTDDGGRIVLRVAREERMVRVEVEDDGIGMEAEALESVFDLFAQVDAYDVRVRGGLGIGLTLARTLVEMHGGDLTVRSDGPGRGSCFVARLPLTEAPVQGVEFAAAAGTRRLVGRRVMVVDDNRDAADSLAVLLGMHQAQVRTAYDGPGALVLAREFAPDVAILDLGMPGMSGYQVARSLRAAGSAPQLLIALSGWGQPQDRRESLAAGFDHHLLKPVELEQILGLLAPPSAPAASLASG